MLDLELRYLPRSWPGARLLDVGFGAGAFLRWASAAGWQAVGIDPDPIAVAAARETGLRVYQGSIEQTPPEAPFDVITANHVVEHVHDPRRMLERVHDLLKPGGLVWIETPNLSSVGHQIFGAAWLGLDPPRHLVLFTRSRLHDLLTALGFRVLRTLPRAEVTRFTFPASDRIARGCPDPLQPAPGRLSVRLRSHQARWQIRQQPGRAEFIAVIAQKQ
jgi:2-polyprenyl-3-methyl-5-hydroxy-6-metoxy-1,4-benzoquinol methylase